MNTLIKTTTTCPICRRTAKPRLKVHEVEDSDKITVTEYCGYCRTQLSQRLSTDQIERIRRDILRLQKRVEAGESFMSDVLIARLNRYNMLTSNLKRDENN